MHDIYMYVYIMLIALIVTRMNGGKQAWRRNDFNMWPREALRNASTLSQYI